MGLSIWAGWEFPKLGAHYGSPCNKDHDMLGSILGLPVFGEARMGIYTDSIYYVSILTATSSRLRSLSRPWGVVRLGPEPLNSGGYSGALLK